MPLEMRKSSKWWYGRFNSAGKVYCKNLGIKIEGERPCSITNEGDRRFEQSRAKAQAHLDQLINDASRRKTSEELVQTLHEIQTGRRIQSIPLNQMYEAWEAIPRRRKPCDAKISWAKAVFKRFIDFFQANVSTVHDMAGVTQEHAIAFLNSRKIAPATWNAEISLLKNAFRMLRRSAGIVDNPFEGIETKEENSYHRKPFTPEELKAILDAARNDDFCRPLIVVGMCTAMRRGDVCLLKWSAVDIEHRFITVKTSKTGVDVAIPMFPLLYDELSSIQRTASEYCFPEQAQMYLSNIQGINHRLQRVFRSAGFVDAEELPEDNSIQHRDNVHAEKHENGVLRPNIRGFHALRATWVTLALTAGVPIELVKRVTGHHVTQTVLDKYFQPGREQFRQALQTAMPKLLTNGSMSKEDELKKLVENLNGKNWRKVRDELLTRLAEPKFH